MKEKSNNLRMAVFRVIQPDSTGYWPSQLFDWAITALILLSVASVFVVTLDLTADVRDSLRGFEAAVSVVFTLESHFASGLRLNSIPIDRRGGRVQSMSFPEWR